MRKTGIALAVVAVVALVMPMTVQAEEGTWFDLANCSMCKNLSAEKGLMAHVTWETHMVSNGALTVTKVDPAYREAFERAHHKMEAVGAKLESGEQMHLCGFCMSYGKLAQQGAKMEMVATEGGDMIALTTSDNPEVVGLIQAHAKRTMQEYETWKASTQQASAGH